MPAKSTGPAVRLLDREDLVDAARLVARSMLSSIDDETSAMWGAMFEGDVTHGAISAGGQLVGVARWFDADLSLKGRHVPAAAVTAVAVLANHRRQGHLRRLMAHQLDSVAEAEVPIALLVAAEWPIYGRFGYGPAVDACGFEVDATAARFSAPPEGTIELVSAAELRPHLEEMHDMRWERTIGAVKRSAAVWDRIAGLARWPNDKSDPGRDRGAVWRDAAGDVKGAVAYRVEEGWVRNRPAGKIHVRLLVGASPVAEREMWRHLCENDWVTVVVAGNRAIDDPLPLWVDDGRAAVQVDHFDCIWARLMDVPRVLGARRSPVAGGAVLEVLDEAGYANGRWRLEIGPTGAEVTRTRRAPDVRLPVATLGAASLGGTSVTRLHEAGWLEEETPGAVGRLDALLRSDTAPWSPTTY